MTTKIDPVNPNQSILNIFLGQVECANTDWQNLQFGLDTTQPDYCLRKIHSTGLEDYMRGWPRETNRRGDCTPHRQDLGGQDHGGPAATIGAMAEMHAAFRRELDGVNESLRQMRAHHNAAGLGGGQDQQGGGQGGRGQGGNQDIRTTVKTIGDIHRTLRSICRAPDLSHANLADFDQWSQEMMHTIETARTNDPQYNRINIEFIYGSIDLELRGQVEGHVPSKMSLINMTMPEAYLLELEKLYTPADHLSTKRSEFEGQTTSHRITHGVFGGNVYQSQV